MGYIKEPPDINFTVDPKPLSKEDRAQISEAIARFKSTGKKTKARKGTIRKNKNAA